MQCIEMFHKLLQTFLSTEIGGIDVQNTYRPWEEPKMPNWEYLTLNENKDTKIHMHQIYVFKELCCSHSLYCRMLTERSRNHKADQNIT